MTGDSNLKSNERKDIHRHSGEAGGVIPSDTNKTKVQILLIEDSIADAVIFQEYLADSPEPDQYRLVHLKRLSKAGKVIRRHKFDVIILDLNLPDGHGKECLEYISKIAPNVPVIILTGNISESESTQYIGGGAQDYLIKSEVNSGEALVRAICHAIERKRLERAHHKVAEQAQLAAKWTSLTDPLTKLPNRRALEPQLEKQIANARRNHESVAILFLDLDDLKTVNDNLGHDAGDALIANSADRLRAAVRDCDTIVRFGGDEFIIALGGIHNREMPSLIAKRIQHAISQPINYNGSAIRTTASIGLSMYPYDSSNWGELISFADQAMYYAKEMGKNEIAFYSEQLDIQEREMQRLVLDMGEAVKNKDQFRLVYQPIYDLNSSKLVGAHPLLRWQHPERGELLPRSFLRLAEMTGDILAINDWIYETAMKEVLSIYDRGVWPFRLDLNVSKTDMNYISRTSSLDLPSRIHKHLEKTQFPAKYLNLRISEAGVMRRQNESRQLIRSIQEIGAKVILDDFGTQHSKLNIFQGLNLDGVLLQRTLLSEAETDEKTNRLIHGIIQLIHSLDTPTMVKNVESDSQALLAYLWKTEFGEGFHFGQPVPLKNLMKG